MHRSISVNDSVFAFKLYVLPSLQKRPLYSVLEQSQTGSPSTTEHVPPFSHGLTVHHPSDSRGTLRLPRNRGCELPYLRSVIVPLKGCMFLTVGNVSAPLRISWGTPPRNRSLTIFMNWRWGRTSSALAWPSNTSTLRRLYLLTVAKCQLPSSTCLSVTIVVSAQSILKRSCSRPSTTDSCRKSQ